MWRLRRLFAIFDGNRAIPLGYPLEDENPLGSRKVIYLSLYPPWDILGAESGCFRGNSGAVPRLPFIPSQPRRSIPVAPLIGDQRCCGLGFGEHLRTYGAALWAIGGSQPRLHGATKRGFGEVAEAREPAIPPRHVADDPVTSRSPCARLKHLQIHFPNRPAPIGQRFAECVGRGKAAADRDAVIGRGIIGQDGFPLIAPSPQDAFEAPKLAVVLNELVRFGQHAGGAPAFEDAQGVCLLPAIVQAKRLRDETPRPSGRPCRS